MLFPLEEVILIVVSWYETMNIENCENLVGQMNCKVLPYITVVIVVVFRHEGRTWYTPHRGRLWIAATAKTPTPQEIADNEQTYRYLYKGFNSIPLKHEILPHFHKF